MPETRLKTAAIIFNPIKVDLPALREGVAREAENAGWGESLWLETSKEDVGQALARNLKHTLGDIPGSVTTAFTGVDRRVDLGMIRINGIVRRTKAGRALAGEHRNDRDLHYETGQSIAVRLSRPEEIELDGDGFGKAAAFRAWIEAGGLTVRVPATE